VCSVNQICLGSRSPSVGLPRLPANAAHAGRDTSKGAAMMAEKLCEVCGRPFKPERSRFEARKYCSRICYFKTRTQPILGRFLAKVKVDKTSTCWIWTGGTTRGYGTIGVRGTKTRPAHRVSYELFVGQIPAGLFVCHRCDNRPCVNPDHLFVGTAKDNSQDMVAKGRSNPGEGRPNHKFTEAQALEIINCSTTPKELAKKYGVFESAIRSIRTGKNWPHLHAAREAARLTIAKESK